MPRPNFNKRVLHVVSKTVLIQYIVALIYDQISLLSLASLHSKPKQDGSLYIWLSQLTQTLTYQSEKSL